jgi:Putative prokaryotic signal transducing protein
LLIWRYARRAKNDGGAEILRELVRTNDAVLISAIEALLKGADIPHLVADQNISVLEGSIGAFQRRILVGEDEIDAARELLAEAGFGNELRPDVG